MQQETNIRDKFTRLSLLRGKLQELTEEINEETKSIMVSIPESLENTIYALGNLNGTMLSHCEETTDFVEILSEMPNEFQEMNLEQQLEWFTNEYKTKKQRVIPICIAWNFVGQINKHWKEKAWFRFQQISNDMKAMEELKLNKKPL
jgi:hypothetical protein